MDLHVRVWYGNAGSPKEFSKEQTVILLFDPEEPAPVCLLAGGSRHTAQGSLEPWDYATEIGPEHMTVTVTYGWPPSLFDVPLDLSELCAFSQA